MRVDFTITYYVNRSPTSGGLFAFWLRDLKRSECAHRCFDKEKRKKGSVQTFYLQASRGGFVTCAKLRSRSVFWRCDAATPVDIQLGRPADGGAATGSGNSRQLVFDVCPFDV